MVVPALSRLNPSGAHKRRPRRSPGLQRTPLCLWKLRHRVLAPARSQRGGHLGRHRGRIASHDRATQRQQQPRRQPLSTQDEEKTQVERERKRLRRCHPEPHVPVSDGQPRPKHFVFPRIARAAAHGAPTCTEQKRRKRRPLKIKAARAKRDQRGPRAANARGADLGKGARSAAAYQASPARKHTRRANARTERRRTETELSTTADKDPSAVQHGAPRARRGTN